MSVFLTSGSLDVHVSVRTAIAPGVNVATVTLFKDLGDPGSLDNFGGLFPVQGENALIMAAAGSALYNYAGALVFGNEFLPVIQMNGAYIRNEGTIFAVVSDAININVTTAGTGATITNANMIRQDAPDHAAINIVQTSTVVTNIVNTGTIAAYFAAIEIGAVAARTSIINTGTMSAAHPAIQVVGGASAGFDLVNGTTGKISGGIDAGSLVAANDTITNSGQISGDVLLGGGDDGYYGAGSGKVTGLIDGGSGDDTLRGGSGKDTMSGGDGHDVADYSTRTSTVTVTLNGSHAVSVKVGGSTEDSIVNFEAVYGGSAADKLTGDSGANTLQGGGGKDSLDGGGGLDVASYADKTKAVIATVSASMAVKVGSSTEETVKNFEGIAGGSAADRLSGDSHNNVLIGNGDNDTLIGGSGNDTLKGGLGSDSMDGGSGVDLADLSDARGHLTITLDASGNATAFNSVIADGTDTLKGIEGLIGGTGWDTLTGNGAANTLIGNDGNDQLWGRGGADVLTGGKGTDGFVFSTTDTFGGNNVDTITDFVSGTDRIYLDTDGGIAPGSQIPSNYFEQHSGHVSAGAVLIYDQSNGQLWYDADGAASGAAVEVAQLGTAGSHPASLAYTDFYLA